MEFADVLALLALSILAAAMVVWYYYWRRRMLWLMREIVAALEEGFKPVDKNYVILGYLVGFKAEYKLDSSGGRRAYSMLLMMPRHSLLYYPVARFLTARIDRLDILVKDARIKPRRCHLVLEGWLKLLKRDHISVEGLRNTVVEYQGRSYHVYYEREEDRDILVNTLMNSGGKYIRISCIPEENAVLATMRAEPDAAVEAARDLPRILRLLGGRLQEHA